MSRNAREKTVFVVFGLLIWAGLTSLGTFYIGTPFAKSCVISLIPFALILGPRLLLETAALWIERAPD